MYKAQYMAKLVKVVALFLLILCCVASVSALNVVNSKDWQDVYSVMLYSSFNDEGSVFVKSESFTEVTRTVPDDSPLFIYTSDNPYIANLNTQLRGGEYNVDSEVVQDDFMFELDPETGKYIVISEDNFRTAVSLVPYAKQNDAWVLFVSSDNVDEVADRIQGASEVLAVGNFRRDVYTTISPFFTEEINNNNIFVDSQRIAAKFDNYERVILTDGSALEVEFFNTELPVLLSGFNRILDDTFDFLENEGVKSVIIVGNRLAVIGDQIRSKSNKQISVFIKFGQTDVKDVGTLYALSFFPLPRPSVGLAITSAAYNPSQENVVVTFENTGNVGVYELTTVRIVDGENELASASDPEVNFLGVGEVLPVTYDISLLPEQVGEETTAEFFTSFGALPGELDSFLTEEGKYGPPFSMQLQLQDLGDDDTQVDIVSAEYVKSLKRVAVTVVNNGSESAYYSVKIKELLVNGLPEDFYKEESQPLGAGEEKTTYISAQLDEVDLLDNGEFDVTILYGKSKDLMLKSTQKELPFVVVQGVNWLLIGGVAAVVIIILLLVVILLRKPKAGKVDVVVKSAPAKKKARKKRK